MYEAVEDIICDEISVYLNIAIRRFSKVADATLLLSSIHISPYVDENM